MVFDEVSMSQPKIIFWVDQKSSPFSSFFYGNRLLSVAIEIIVGTKDKINSVESGSSDSDAVEPALRGLDKIVHEDVDIG